MDVAGLSEASAGMSPAFPPPGTLPTHTPQKNKCHCSNICLLRLHRAQEQGTGSDFNGARVRALYIQQLSTVQSLLGGASSQFMMTAGVLGGREKR